MSTGNYSYRIGTIEDAEALHSLGMRAYSQFETVLTPDNWNIFKNNLQNRQNLLAILKLAKCFVCVDADKIIGVAYIIPSGNPTELFKAEWSYVRKVGIDPEYRGHGLARSLTKMCIDYAIQKNEKTIALHTSEFMDAARHIYESMGFKVLKEIPPLFGKRYWLYTLDL